MISRLFAGWNAVGWTGVDLFFALSGFLVSGLLFSEIQERGKANLPAFLIRRAFKIYPSYYALLIASFLTLGRMPGLPEASKYVFLVQNYLGFDDLLLHTWSLAVEEHFYLLLTLSLWVLGLRGKLWTNVELVTPLLAVLVCVAGLLLRIDYSNTHPYAWSKQMTLTHLRLDALSFGLLLSWVYHFRRAWFDSVSGKHRALLAIGGICLLGSAAFFDVDAYFMHVYGFTLTYAGAGLLVASSLGQGWPWRSKAARVFAEWVGRPSYSIYLWHVLLSFFLAPQLELLHLSSPVIDLAFLAASIVVGNVAYEILESPLLRFRDLGIFARVARKEPN